MQAISKGLEKVIQELSASENDGPVSEVFCQVQPIAGHLNLFSKMSYQKVVTSG